MKRHQMVGQRIGFVDRDVREKVWQRTILTLDKPAHSMNPQRESQILSGGEFSHSLGQKQQLWFGSFGYDVTCNNLSGVVWITGIPLPILMSIAIPPH
jgi:hypothetical protein